MLFTGVCLYGIAELLVPRFKKEKYGGDDCDYKEEYDQIASEDEYALGDDSDEDGGDGDDDDDDEDEDDEDDDDDDESDDGDDDGDDGDNSDDDESSVSEGDYPKKRRIQSI